MDRQAHEPRLILAPLRGFSDHIFRTVYSRHFTGFDSALAPFIPAVTANGFRPAHLRDVLPENNTGMPVEPQLLGNRPQDFIHLSHALQALGYESVNWNLGCPYPMVAKKMRGCGLLPHPEVIDAFLEQVVAEIPLRLSIKMRLGRRHAGEITALIPILNRYPLKEIVLHPRTGKQMYSGALDLDAFDSCLEAIRHRVVYNGDITGRERFAALADRFSSRVGGWMIGRGALIDPFLPAAIKGVDCPPEDALGRFKRFYDDLFDSYRREFSGPGHLLDRMKGFWTYFSQAFVDGRRIAKRIHRTRRLETCVHFVETFFAEEAKWGPAPKSGSDAESPTP
jgi:tRNA-dihydrouridine synthase